MANKKISIKALDRIAAEAGKDKVEVDWHGETLVVNAMLTLGESILFIESIMSTCFDTSTGEYHPEVYDFAVRSATAAMYTNISVPENAEHQYKLLYKTDLIDTVTKYINKEQYEEMLRAAAKKLRYELDVNKQFITKKLEETAAGVENLANRVAEIFADVTPEDVKKLTQALGNGFSEERLVQAIVGNVAGNGTGNNGGEVENNG